MDARYPDVIQEREAVIQRSSRIVATLFMLAVQPVAWGQVPIKERSPTGEHRFPPLPDMIQRRHDLEMRKSRIGVLNKFAHWAVETGPDQPAPKTLPQAPAAGAVATKQKPAPKPKASEEAITPASLESVAVPVAPRTGSDLPIEEPPLSDIKAPQVEDVPIPILPEAVPADVTAAKTTGPLLTREKMTALEKESLEQATQRAEAALAAKASVMETGSTPALPRPSMVAPSMVRDSNTRPPSIRRSAVQAPTILPTSATEIEGSNAQAQPAIEIPTDLPKESQTPRTLPQTLPDIPIPTPPVVHELSDNDIAESRRKLEEALKAASKIDAPIPAESAPESKPQDSMDDVRKELADLAASKWNRATQPSPAPSAPSVESPAPAEKPIPIPSVSAKQEPAKAAEDDVQKARAELEALGKNLKETTPAPAAKPGPAPAPAPPAAPAPAAKKPTAHTASTPPAGGDTAIELANQLKKMPQKASERTTVPGVPPVPERPFETKREESAPTEPSRPPGLTFARETLEQGIRMPPPPKPMDLPSRPTPVAASAPAPRPAPEVKPLDVDALERKEHAIHPASATTKESESKVSTAATPKPSAPPAMPATSDPPSKLAVKEPALKAAARLPAPMPAPIKERTLDPASVQEPKLKPITSERPNKSASNVPQLKRDSAPPKMITDVTLPKPAVSELPKQTTPVVRETKPVVSSPQIKRTPIAPLTKSVVSEPEGLPVPNVPQIKPAPTNQAKVGRPIPEPAKGGWTAPDKRTPAAPVTVMEPEPMAMPTLNPLPIPKLAPEPSVTPATARSKTAETPNLVQPASTAASVADAVPPMVQLASATEVVENAVRTVPAGIDNVQRARQLTRKLGLVTQPGDCQTTLHELAGIEYWYRVTGTVDAVIHVAQYDDDIATRLVAVEMIGSLPGTMVDATGALRAIVEGKTDSTVRKAAQEVLQRREGSQTR